MWQLNKTAICWSYSILALVLLPACSQSPPDRAISSSPAIVQPDAASTSESSTPTTAESSPSKIDQPKSQPTPANQVPSTNQTASPVRQPARSTSTPNTPANLTDSLHPTFRAEQRMAGFSADGNYYIYLESSRDSGAGIPKSSLQVVDVSSSHCVENGCVETRYGESDAKLETQDAEADLLKQTWKVRQELKLTPPTAGTDLAIVSRSRTADGTETVMVRLNDNQPPLRLRLQQKRVGADRGQKAAMQLEVSYNGQQQSLNSLDNFKDSVIDYSIRSVKLAPNGKRVAVLITAAKPTFEGTLGTTLVQGFEL